jgi:hypothetical protein
MVSVLWPKPISTPATPTYYPDVVRGPLQPFQYIQFWEPNLPPIPTLPNLVITLGPKQIIVPILGPKGVIMPLLGAKIL